MRHRPLKPKGSAQCRNAESYKIVFPRPTHRPRVPVTKNVTLGQKTYASKTATRKAIDCRYGVKRTRPGSRAGGRASPI
jgi:hypothetical protein